MTMHAVPRPGRRTGQRPHLVSRLRTISAAALVVTLMSALTACAGVGSTSEKPADTRAEATMTAQQAETVVDDYDSRRNAALTASVRAFDPVPWSKADTGILYARNRLDTAVRKVEGNRRTTTSAHTVRTVFAPAHESFPRLAILDLDRTTGGRVTSVVAALTQQDEGSPWLMASTATHRGATLPGARGAGRAATLLPAARTTLAARADELVTQLNAGKGPWVTGDLAAEAKALATPAAGRTEYRLWSPQKDQLAPRGSIHAVAVEDGGALALLDLVAETVHDAPPGEYFDTRRLHDSYLEATGQSSEYATQIRLRNGLTVVALLDAKGGLSVLGADSAGIPLEGGA